MRIFVLTANYELRVEKATYVTTLNLTKIRMQLSEQSLDFIIGFFKEASRNLHLFLISWPK